MKTKRLAVPMDRRIHQDNQTGHRVELDYMGKGTVGVYTKQRDTFERVYKFNTCTNRIQDSAVASLYTYVEGKLVDLAYSK